MDVILDEDFDEWMEDLREIVWREMSLDIEELPDYPYRKWYEDFLSPEESMEIIVEDIL